jgi:hypothetical protein
MKKLKPYKGPLAACWAAGVRKQHNNVVRYFEERWGSWLAKRFPL